MLKRILSSLVLLPIVTIVLIWGNKYLVDVIISLIAVMALYEYFNAFKEDNKGLRAIGYFAALCISCIHLIPREYVLKTIAVLIPVSVLVLFAKVIATNMKYNIKDIAITFFGICYIVVFLMFIPLIREMKNGRVLIWFVFVDAWATDIFAFFIGRKFGKHKFTKISPNKSIEGCIAGTLGAIICMLLYAFICNNVFNVHFEYYTIAIMAVVLSLVGQLGDLAASSIKRYTDIKDFSNLIPGHGGILDRIDSVIFIAPFAYFLLLLI